MTLKRVILNRGIINMYKKLLILFLLIILGSYSAMLFTTNSVINDFYDVVNNDLDESNSYGELERYKVPSFASVTYKETNSKIRRIFVLHNSNKGVMYVKYSYIMYDVTGDVITGSTNIFSKWYLKKSGNRWLVTDIDEKP